MIVRSLMLLYVLGIASCHTFLSEESKKDDALSENSFNGSLNIGDNQNNKRILQSCSQNCQYCEYGVCLMCKKDRVIPDCNCKQGFYQSDSGTCLPCISNCKACANGSTCEVCYDRFTVDPNTSKCSCKFSTGSTECENDGEIYYQAFIGQDMQSVEVIFSSPIRVKEDNLNNFIPQFTNCLILDSNSQLMYGLTYLQGRCFISPNEQYKFIIYLSANVLVDQIQNKPTFDVKYLMKYKDELISPVTSVLSSQTLIYNQLNSIKKICWFQNTLDEALIEQTFSSPIQIIYPYLSWLTTAPSERYLCYAVNNPSILASCNQQQFTIAQQYITSNLQQTIAVECTGLFGIRTVDQAIIKQVSYKSTPIVLKTEQVLSSYMFSQDFTNKISYYYSTNTLDSIKLNVVMASGLKNPLEITTQGPSSENTFYDYSIPHFALSSEQMVTLNNIENKQIKTYCKQIQKLSQVKSTNYLQTLQVQQIMYLQYNSSYTVNLSPQFIPSFIPSQELQIQASILDNDQESQDLSRFSLKVVCLQSPDKSLCTDQQGKLLQIPQELNFKLPANSLSMNKYYKITFITKRKSNPLSLRTDFVAVRVISAQLSLSQSSVSSLSQINFSDTNIAELIYTSDVTAGQLQYTLKFQISQNYPIKTISSSSNQIPFSIIELYPDLDITNSPKVTLYLSVFDSFINQNIPSSSGYIINLRIPPNGCQLMTSYESQIGFKSKIDLTVTNCQLDNANTYTYQYYYYSSKSKRQEEIKQPFMLTRKLLSVLKELPTSSVILPPGDLLLMVVIKDNFLNSANFTSSIKIQDNKFTMYTFQFFVYDQQAKAISYQSSSVADEILTYQIITEAIEYYETSNSTYVPSTDVFNTKNQILNRLYDLVWEDQGYDLLLFSKQLVLRIKNTKIKISMDDIKKLSEQNQRSIDSLNQKIENDLSTITSQKRYQYQTLLIATIQDYMKNNLVLNQWKNDTNQNIINYTSKMMQGLSQVMITNEDPITVQTSGAELSTEKLDFKYFMKKYFDDEQSQEGDSQVKQLFYVNYQSWPETHPLFRDELKDINKSYLEKATPEQAALLKKQYPVKLLQVQTNIPTGRRRFLEISPAKLSKPIGIEFNGISKSEQLKCIQRSDFGKWVANSCTTEVKEVNGNKKVVCKCSKPSLTSLSADVEAIFNNENLKDIFSEDGFLRVFSLKNWYEYAAFWTIILLNILLIVSIVYGYKLDHQDKQIILNKQIEKDEEQKNIEEQIKQQKNEQKQKSKKQNLFMEIKKKQTNKYIYKQNTILSEDKKEQEENIAKSQDDDNNNNIENYENNSKKEQQKRQRVKNNTDIHILGKLDKYEQNKEEISQKSKNDRNSYSSAHQKHSSICNENQNSQYNQIDFIQVKIDNNAQKQEIELDQLGYEDKLENYITNSNHINFITLPEDKKTETQLDQCQFYSPFVFPQESSPQPLNKELHVIKFSDQIQLSDQLYTSQQSQCQSDAQQNKAIKSSFSSQIDKKQEKEQKKKEEKLKKQQQLLEAKQKAEEYLQKQDTIKGILSFHILGSIFLLYNEEMSRPLRFIVYYNKLVWLLTINSIFGKDLSIVQVIILSSITTVVLLIVTNIVQIFLSKKKIQAVGLVITSLFLLFCYYSILVVISGQKYYEANQWIGSFFATFILNEFIIGIMINASMYYFSKKSISKIQNETLLSAIGLGLLLKAFQ